MFMDLAGAPSGFSHYIYWRKQHSARVNQSMPTKDIPN